MSIEEIGASASTLRDEQKKLNIGVHLTAVILSQTSASQVVGDLQAKRSFTSSNC